MPANIPDDRIHPPIVRVRWRDAAIVTNAWQDTEEAGDEGLLLVMDPLTSAGFLIADDPRGIVVASSYNQHHDDAAGAMAIPRSAIVSIEQLHDGNEGS